MRPKVCRQHDIMNGGLARYDWVTWSTWWVTEASWEVRPMRMFCGPRDAEVSDAGQLHGTNGGVAQRNSQSAVEKSSQLLLFGGTPAQPWPDWQTAASMLTQSLFTSWKQLPAFCCSSTCWPLVMQQLLGPQSLSLLCSCGYNMIDTLQPTLGELSVFIHQRRWQSGAAAAVPVCCGDFSLSWLPVVWSIRDKQRNI